MYKLGIHQLVSLWNFIWIVLNAIAVNYTCRLNVPWAQMITWTMYHAISYKSTWPWVIEVVWWDILRCFLVKMLAFLFSFKFFENNFLAFFFNAFTPNDISLLLLVSYLASMGKIASAKKGCFKPWNNNKHTTITYIHIQQICSMWTCYTILPQL